MSINAKYVSLTYFQATYHKYPVSNHCSAQTCPIIYFRYFVTPVFLMYSCSKYGLYNLTGPFIQCCCYWNWCIL